MDRSCIVMLRQWTNRAIQIIVIHINNMETAIVRGFNPTSEISMKSDAIPRRMSGI